MAVDWPLTLPQAPASFSERPASNAIRTEPDTGPAKSRRRFTKAKRTADMSFLLTIAQYDILDDFFTVDCKDGTIAMNFRHPWKQVVMPMFITEPPTYNNDGNLGVNVSVKVEYF